MINKDDYTKYFGVSTAPSSLERLENLSLQIIKSIITHEIPTEPAEDETDEAVILEYTNFMYALMEQAHFLSDNPDLMEDILSFGSGYSLGKFSENSNNTKIQLSDTSKRLSPNSYVTLLNMGYLYAGSC